LGEVRKSEPAVEYIDISLLIKLPRLRIEIIQNKCSEIDVKFNLREGDEFCVVN